MEEKVQKFLDKVLEERKEKLLGLTLDIEFFNIMLEKYPEESLRKELASENEKLIKDEKGRVVEDNRDLDKVSNIEKMITKSGQAKTQLEQYSQVYRDIEEYISYIEKKDGFLISKLNEIVLKK